MRVCDGSCRRLASIERRLPPLRTTHLINQLRRQAAALSGTGYEDAVSALAAAADALEQITQDLARNT
ncbi:hypothetical protein BI364_11495 [Acidihalobacter yilgarnensis]|uniref:Uncharacterized protein n=1 Tax=Acidihalobacter yilgarnensis TaxID=2819280 RepID=A0A1D8IPV2_9GAMM|nr:hypothetical protein BI364_11495 [Acidihalobacter yilgarnensis]